MKAITTTLLRALGGATFATCLLSTSATAQCPLDDDAGTNDTCATAQAIATGSTTGYTATDLSGDFYTFTVAAGSSAQVNVLFSNAIADIDIAVFDDAGTCANQVASGASVTDNEVVTVGNCTAAPITFTLNVFLFSGACNDYSINIVVSGSSCPGGDDMLEDNDTAATASPLTLPFAQTGLVVSCVDADWYAFTVGTAQDLSVNALFTHSTGNIDLRLFDNAGTTQLAAATSTTDNETLAWTNLTGSPAMVKLQVSRANAGACNTYILTGQESPSACAGPDDAQEQNDTCLTAVVPSGNPLTGLFVHKTDKDYYILSVGANEVITADVLFTHANGDVDALFIDPNDCTTVLDFGTSVTDNEQVTWTNPNPIATTIILEVQVWSGSTQNCNTYDMMWASVPDPCTVTPDDSFEENDSCGTAAAITTGLTTGLFVRYEGVDNDWYSISVPAGATISADAIFLDANGDIDIEMYDACGGTLLDSGAQSGVDIENASWTNMGVSAVTVFINVFVWAGSIQACNTYDLNIDISGGMSNLIPYCFGDGSGVSCPCGNNSSPGHGGGCAHQNGNGTILTGSGNPSVAMDTLHFDLTSGPFNTFSVLVSGNNQLPQTGACIGCGIPAFDGLRCAGGAFVRHGSRAVNASGATNAGWGPPAGPATGLILQGGFVAGQTRNFFAFVRTDPMATCTTGQNSSNGISVMIMP